MWAHKSRTGKGLRSKGRTVIEVNCCLTARYGRYPGLDATLAQRFLGSAQGIGGAEGVLRPYPHHGPFLMEGRDMLDCSQNHRT